MILRLNERVLSLGKILQSAACPVAMVSSNVYHMAWREAKALERGKKHPRTIIRADNTIEPVEAQSKRPQE